MLPTQQDISHRWQSFWRDACALNGSITPHVLPNVLLMGALACGVSLIAYVAARWFGIYLALPIAPYEIVGASLAVLLVLRTNAGYDRWWEARKLWGGIVNQSRNLAISGLSYGPQDEAWRERFARWTAAFSVSAKMALRGEGTCPALTRLLGEEDAARVAATRHMPSTIALTLGRMLNEAVQYHGMDQFAFLQIDKERAQLIDHIGACERILKTPLALAYSIKIRRFIGSFLLSLPFALLHSLDNPLLVPLITMLVAYPLFSLDQLGVELQNPFNVKNLSHLPLDDIAGTIEANVLSLLEEHQTQNIRNKVALRV
jgi:ion channel-forming bestrophin family protein